MTPYPQRRHPLQTFQFWFFVMTAVVVASAWKLQFLTEPQEQPVAEEFQPLSDPPDAVGESLAPSTLAVDEIDLGPAVTDVEPIPWAQSEPTAAPPQQNEAPRPLPVAAETPAPMPTPQPLPKPEADGHVRMAAASFPADVASAPAAVQDNPVPSSFNTVIASTSTPSPSGDSAPAPTPAAQSPDDDTLAKTEAASPPTGTSPPTSILDLAKIDDLIAKGEDVAAHRLLSTAYWQRPQRRDEIRGRLDSLARRIYFQPHPHYNSPYEVQPAEVLEKIARRYNVTWEYLAKLNRTQPERIRPGQKLKVIQGPFNAIVDLSDFELTVHAYGYYVARFPIGTGKDGSTPIGTFHVTDKLVDPTYYGPDGVIAHDDPLNPLGERWIAINDDAGSLDGYGIHGTIEPESIGQEASRGCVRLRDQDIADLYELLTVGSEVVIRP